MLRSEFHISIDKNKKFDSKTQIICLYLSLNSSKIIMMQIIHPHFGLQKESCKPMICKALTHIAITDSSTFDDNGHCQ